MQNGILIIEGITSLTATKKNYNFTTVIGRGLVCLSYPVKYKKMIIF